MNRRTVIIGGIAPSYEWSCQRMLDLGLAWLKENPNFDFTSYKVPRGIIGVCISEDARARELDRAVLEDPQIKAFGATGAMHQYVIGHLAYIHQHGYESWLEECAKHRPPEDFFDWDGTMQSCGFIPEPPPLPEDIRQQFGLAKDREQ